MKVFALLLLLFLCAALMVVNGDELFEDSCVTCFEQPYNPVCGKRGKAATYYNDCARTCENAEVLHPGECTLDDIINNQEMPY